MKEDFETLLRALLLEREKLLETCSDLKEFQKIIDQEIKVQDPLERAKKVNELLLRKLNDELIPAMYHLRKLQAKINTLTDEELRDLTKDNKESA